MVSAPRPISAAHYDAISGAISGDLLTREGRSTGRVTYSFRSASCLRPSSSYHESYILGGTLVPRRIAQSFIKCTF